WLACSEEAGEPPAPRGALRRSRRAACTTGGVAANRGTGNGRARQLSRSLSMIFSGNISRRRAMLTAEGCRARRQRLWQQLDPPPDTDHLRLTDPIHLAWLAGFHVDPFSLGGGFGGFLLLRNDGHGKLLH